MVYISKVYTRFGDEGQTMLADGATVRKDSARVQAYGEVDELNATLALVRLELGRERPDRQAGRQLKATLDHSLTRIQQELFNLGAELATPGAGEDEGTPRSLIEDRHVMTLEAEIDALNEGLPPLRSFILPGGGPAGSAAHLARTVCRRAERRVLALASIEPVRGEARRYLNRLSDLLFVLARATAQAFGHPEVLWVPEET